MSDCLSSAVDTVRLVWVEVEAPCLMEAAGCGACCVGDGGGPLTVVLKHG